MVEVVGSSPIFPTRLTLSSFYVKRLSLIFLKNIHTPALIICLCVDILFTFKNFIRKTRFGYHKSKPGSTFSSFPFPSLCAVLNMAPGY